MSPPDLIVTGGLLVDNVVTASGALHRGQIGGNALYAAAAAHLAGQKAGVVGHAPANYPNPELVRLAEAGLDLAGVHRSRTKVELEEWFFYRSDGSRRDGLFATAGEADAHGMTGERVEGRIADNFAALLVAQAPAGMTYGAFRRAHPIRPADVPADWWRARGLHLAANDPAAQLALARAAREKGLVITWDPGPRAADIDTALLRELMPLVDIAAPSEVELATLAPALSCDCALRRLVAFGARVALVKRGSKGVLLLPGGEASVSEFPALPADIVDLTGAGDAFCGGLLAGFVEGLPLEGAVRRGLSIASRAVATRGPLALMSAPIPTAPANPD